ncbi:hypothetical protein Q7P35_000340 [Cladosporium inversicolor]
MALVNYSDSEGSDTEAPVVAPAAKAPAKPKLINRTESKKIKVELPQIRPEPGQEGSQEPAPKRARTAGAFSGFNSLLPPPKKTGQNAPKPGISLKTSSEAAFSRTPVPRLPSGDGDGDANGLGKESLPAAAEKKEEEVKIVGKPTRFMPLSVANAKKKKKPIHGPRVPFAEKSTPNPVGATPQQTVQNVTPVEAPPKVKPKVSLFSFGGEETAAPTEKPSSNYQPEFADPEANVDEEVLAAQTQQAAAPSSNNTLSDIASDLDLTPAQRRQLFGRGGTNAGNIAHFNMDTEYRSNQEMAASGETFEHKQVKTIAPGKHSLQQLVNNVKSQTDALEDKWAEGRRNRGEGGSNVLSRHSNDITMVATGVACVPLCASCQSPGDAACKACLLVTYCSKSCQTAHWSTHKRDCKSPLKSPGWQLNWMKEHRVLAHADIDEYGFVKNQMNTTKYLWGNVPAFDTIQLSRNEGAGHKDHLKVLFAASGDLRNVVKTVGSPPNSYGGNISVIINDIDFDIVARNIILVLLALTIPDHQKAIETIIHCWYSAFIRPEDLQYLESLHSLFQAVCDELADRGAASIEARTWKFGKCSVSVMLDKEHWMQLLGFITLSKDLTTQQAHDIRKDVTDSPQRLDFIQRFLLMRKPEHRICKENFRDEGILLPFGHSRKEFTIPNPTLFLSSAWPIMDDVEPLEGWNFAEVLETKHSSAANDVYGKLFIHIGSVLSSFNHRLSKFGANFELRNLDAAELPRVLNPGSFARIETSNIGDVLYLGPHRTRNHDVGLQFIWVALPLGRDAEKYFTVYTELGRLNSLAISAGVKIKDYHTIVEKWSTRPKLQPDSPGADAELAKVWGAFPNYMERYVE